MLLKEAAAAAASRLRLRAGGWLQIIERGKNEGH